MRKKHDLSTGVTMHRFLADESGATAIEYALIAAGIGAAVATAVYTLGATVEGLYQKASQAF